MATVENSCHAGCPRPLLNRQRRSETAVAVELPESTLRIFFQIRLDPRELRWCATATRKTHRTRFFEGARRKPRSPFFSQARGRCSGRTSRRNNESLFSRPLHRTPPDPKLELCFRTEIVPP